MLQTAQLLRLQSGVSRQESPAQLDPTHLRDAQDALFCFPGEVRRRGGFSHHSSAHLPEVSSLEFPPAFVIHGEVALSAYRYTYGSTKAVVVVFAGSGTRVRVIKADGSFEVIHMHEAQTATRADICNAWFRASSGTATEAGILVTTDVGAWTIRLDQTGNAAHLVREIAKANDTTFSSTGGSGATIETYNAAGSLTGTSTSSVPGYQLPGSGYKFCATVGAYSFLAGQRGDQGKGFDWPQRMWWSGGGSDITSKDPTKTGMYDSETWLAPNDAGNRTVEQQMDLPFAGGGAITALCELSGSLLIHKKEGILSFRVANDPTAWSDLRQRSDQGTFDHRSIAKYKNGIIFANAAGIWFFDGVALSSLTEGLIDQDWRSLISTWSESWHVVGQCFREHYLVTVTDGTGTFRGAWCCYLPSRAWSRFSNLPLSAASMSENGMNAYAWFTLNGSSYLVVTGDMFSYQPRFQDVLLAPGAVTAPALMIETGQVTGGDPLTVKNFREIEIDYDATAASSTGGIPALQLYTITGTDTFIGQSDNEPPVAVSPALPAMSWTQATAQVEDADLPSVPAANVGALARKRLCGASGNGVLARALGIKIVEVPGNGFRSVRVRGLGVSFKTLRERRV